MRTTGDTGRGKQKRAGAHESIEGAQEACIESSATTKMTDDRKRSFFFFLADLFIVRPSVFTPVLDTTGAGSRRFRKPSGIGAG
jgi:hypothetical protein